MRYCSLPEIAGRQNGSSSTYTIQPRGWLIITMKDNKTIEIVFLRNESRTMISFVSESQSQNMSILVRSWQNDHCLYTNLHIILIQWLSVFTGNIQGENIKLKIIAIWELQATVCRPLDQYHLLICFRGSLFKKITFMSSLYGKTAPERFCFEIFDAVFGDTINSL
jgi:hypothetical protein